MEFNVYLLYPTYYFNLENSCYCNLQGKLIFFGKNSYKIQAM